MCTWAFTFECVCVCNRIRLTVCVCNHIRLTVYIDMYVYVFSLAVSPSTKIILTIEWIPRLSPIFFYHIYIVIDVAIILKLFLQVATLKTRQNSRSWAIWIPGFHITASMMVSCTTVFSFHLLKIFYSILNLSLWLEGCRLIKCALVGREKIIDDNVRKFAKTT